MNWSITLMGYLARRFSLAVLMVFVVFAALAISIDLAELFRRSTGKDVPTGIVFSMSLFKFPDLGLKLLPFTVLFGAILAFARMSRSQELVAARAAGISAWQFLAMPLVVAIVLGTVATTIFSPIAAALLGEYSRLEARYIRGEASQLAVSNAGIWLRQGTTENQSVIHALRVAQQGERLEDVIVFRYAAQDRFVGRIDAKSARLGNGVWHIDSAYVSDQSGRPVYNDTIDLPTDLTPTQIEESFASPATISFWELPRFISNAENAGFSALRHRVYWYSLLTLPVLLSAMVFMAASFSFRLVRLGGTTRLLLTGLIAGLAVYFLQDVTRAMGQTGMVPAPLAAAAPSLAAILLGMTLLFHEEDG